jgi:catechol 2,3-dioxygenase-like lactoylglutathione lyase family enzyme
MGIAMREAPAKGYSRSVEDIGNVVALEHVNVLIPDQRIATAFYVTGLGLTRDPYLMTGTDNMWINIGRSQFHLPTGQPQVLRGHVGLVVPGREALLRRLNGVRQELAGTLFDFREHNAFIEVISPWGNRIRCHEPQPRFGRIRLGMPYVEFDVARGHVEGIAGFYREVMEAPAGVAEDERGRHARIVVGPGQELIYRETDRPPVPYDGHHIQIYIVDFSGPHRRLAERGLITEESDQHQYRFQDIVDLESGKTLFAVEHEVRSFTHPLYNRPLVNRNPAQTNRNYAPGHDAALWSLAQGD